MAKAPKGWVTKKPFLNLTELIRGIQCAEERPDCLPGAGGIRFLGLFVSALAIPQIRGGEQWERKRSLRQIRQRN